MAAAAIPSSALEQHIAVLGKTGSGKTSTAKLAVEQVVPAGSRVCVLDPIKSDWWGLTSSADGKRPGLPFQIIGGPKGHVPLHASAGKAIAGVVADGSLKHSIIDMADFGPRELHPFFVDFASTLFRNIRGVVYLVMEEAHLFAPKERVGEESMSIYWFKRLASAARTKGARIIVCTQRPAELHNTVLASCDTIIAHRVTFPEDQERIVKWFRGHTDKAQASEIAHNLGSLQKGEAYLCSHEAGIFERRQFPKITTYDNTATPTGDGAAHQVKTAPVDQDALRALIGTAVKEAEANDPKRLKAEVQRLTAELAKKPTTVQAPVNTAAIEDTVRKQVRGAWTPVVRELSATAARLAKTGQQLADGASALISELDSNARALSSLTTLMEATPAPMLNGHAPAVRPASKPGILLPPRPPAEGITSRQQRFLDVAATLTHLNTEVSRETVCGWLGVHPRGGSVGEELKALEVAGLIQNDRGRLTVTAQGHAAASPVDPAEAIERAKGGLSPRQTRIFDAVCNVYPESVTRDLVAAEMGIHPRGGSFGEDIARLVGRGLITSDRGSLRARDFLFAA